MVWPPSGRRLSSRQPTLGVIRRPVSIIQCRRRPMAQRKPPTASTSRKTPAGNRPARPSAAGARPPTKPTKKPGKSIVNQKQRPWGTIITAVVVVLFAAAIILYAVTRHKSASKEAQEQPELGEAKEISGL